MKPRTAAEWNRYCIDRDIGISATYGDIVDAIDDAATEAVYRMSEALETSTDTGSYGALYCDRSPDGT